MEETHYDHEEENEMFTTDVLERIAYRPEVVCAVFAISGMIGLINGHFSHKAREKRYEELRQRAFHAPTEEERKEAGKELMEFIRKYGH